MAEFRLNDIAIEGIACAVPNNKVCTESFCKQFGKDTVDNFIKTTGVKSTYRTSEEQTASDLCFVAAENLIQKKQLNKSEIGALVFVSQTPDYRLPATACVLHKRLQLEKSCLCFDVNLGCSGFVYGLNIVGSLLQTNNIDKALLLFGDTSIKTTSPYDKSSIMLFGEAGSATLLVKKSGSEIYGELMTDGEGFKAIIMPSGAFRNMNGSQERTKWGDGNIRSDYDGVMNGTDVFAFTISQVPRLINNLMRNTNTSPDDYEALVLHQANMYILQQLSKKTKFPLEKIPISLDRYGNTSGTSIPLTLCDSYGNDEENVPVNILMSGFGIGLSWGVVRTIINKKNIFPIVYTDDHYTDGAVSHD